MSSNTQEKNYCMRIDYVNITNGDFFTKERLREWRVFIAKCCLNICDGLIKKIDPSNKITYFVSSSLLNEVVGDAVIGMSKIIDKTPHPIEHPNAFKIAAYLGYWFLRHKPISILYPSDVDLNNIKQSNDCKTSPKYLSWQLKHINEAVAVNIVTTFIFDFEKELCSNKECEMIKKKDVKNNVTSFGFESFSHQRQIILQKLTYYFTYRAIAPKVIEHFLEAYAFHPAWGLTGAHWKTTLTEKIDEE